MSRRIAHRRHATDAPVGRTIGARVPKRRQQSGEGPTAGAGIPDLDCASVPQGDSAPATGRQPAPYTRMISLPSFSPLKRRWNVSGNVSMPSTIVSRYAILPVATQPASSVRASPKRSR